MSNKLISNILTDLFCPITREYFRNPVTLDDGITYEYEAIYNWLLKHNNSPISRKKINLNKKTQINIAMKNIIDELESIQIIKSYDRYKKYELSYSSKNIIFIYVIE